MGTRAKLKVNFEGGLARGWDEGHIARLKACTGSVSAKSELQRDMRTVMLCRVVLSHELILQESSHAHAQLRPHQRCHC